MKFEQYNISKGIKSNIKKLGYKKPTDIQFKSIPPILKGEDVLAIAQTGTGKTAAYVIPILENLHRSKVKSGFSNHVRCLVLTPTHELSIQVESVFQVLARHTKVSAFCIHGGVDQAPQIEALKKGVDVLIATPGRMFDLVSQGALNLKKLEVLILDEADHMLDLGFIKDIRDLMKHIPKKRQTLFFSATIDEKIKKIAYSLVSKAIRIQISPKDPVARNVEHSVAFIEMDDKRFFLEELIKSHDEKKILVFVRTKVRAERVKKAMDRVSILSDTIHSDKSHEERKQTLENFRNGRLKVLITTDVSARGIDIPNVEYVINYDLPEASEKYIHRVGRTGRGTDKGSALSFCSSDEKNLLEDIEKKLAKPIERMDISKSDYRYTLDISDAKAQDWQSLMREAEREQKYFKKTKNKRPKKN